MQNTVFSVANNSRKLNAPIRKGSINVAVKCFVVWLYYKYKLKQLLLNSGDKEAPTPKSKPTWLLMITYSQFLMSYSKIYSKNVKRSMENGISSSIKTSFRKWYNRKNVKGFFYFQEVETWLEPMARSDKHTRFVIVL